MGNDRIDRVRKQMADQDVDVLLLSVGPDLPWLIGYEAMPLERLTMLVLPSEGDATLVVPQLEAPRVDVLPGVFQLRPWGETENPVEIVAALAKNASRVAIADRTWARFVLALQQAMSSATFVAGSTVTGPLRAVKDADEIERLAAVAEAADRVADQLHAGDIALVGRSEAAVSAEIGQRLRSEGHDTINFAIVASGPNGASPHHEASARVIERGDVVVCDFGGTMAHYCSDITRTVFTAEPTPRQLEVYETVLAAQQAATNAAIVGASCQDVDVAARTVIEDAGYGEWFIHRTGHGIGVEEHEDPYMVAGNIEPIVAGHAFSVEPGIYLPGEFGVRIEDIVVAATDGPRPLNNAERGPRIVHA